MDLAGIMIFVKSMLISSQILFNIAKYIYLSQNRFIHFS